MTRQWNWLAQQDRLITKSYCIRSLHYKSTSCYYDVLLLSFILVIGSLEFCRSLLYSDILAKLNSYGNHLRLCHGYWTIITCSCDR